MAHNKPMWSVEEISFETVDDMTDDPVVTLLASTPIGTLAFVAEVVVQGTTLVLRGTHVQGAFPGAVGMVNLGQIAQAVMEGMDFDALVVEGAVRTTGARPGRRPREFRYARRVLHLCPAGPPRRQAR